MKIKQQNQEIKDELQSIKTNATEGLNLLKEENKKLSQDNTKVRAELQKTNKKWRKFNLILYNLEEKESKLEDVRSVLNLTSDKIPIVLTQATSEIPIELVGKLQKRKINRFS